MAKQRLVVQPKFAEQIQTLPSPLGVNVPLERGFMIWDKTDALYTGGEFGDGRDVIHFLFNPSTITTDYQANNTSLQAAQMYQIPSDQGNFIPQVLSQTVSFDLYFDRTFELNYGGNGSAINDPAVIGVQADVYQFMQFTGVTRQADQNAAQILKQAGSAGSQVLGALRTSGLMMLIPCKVFFGNALAQMNQNASSSNFNAVSSQVQYYGFISAWTVNYTHFTAAMVPIRAVISVTLTMLANPPIQNEVAIWKDNQKAGRAPYTVQTPYAPGYTPSPPNYYSK